MGAARDIVESAGAPRFWFSDFPLGHSAGKPFDVLSQRDTVRGALSLFDAAQIANNTVQSPQTWSDNQDWKQDFMDVSALSQEVIEKLKKDHERTRALKIEQTQS